LPPAPGVVNRPRAGADPSRARTREPYGPHASHRKKRTANPIATAKVARTFGGLGGRHLALRGCFGPIASEEASQVGGEGTTEQGRDRVGDLLDQLRSRPGEAKVVVVGLEPGAFPWCQRAV